MDKWLHYQKKMETKENLRLVLTVSPMILIVGLFLYWYVGVIHKTNIAIETNRNKTAEMAQIRTNNEEKPEDSLSETQSHSSRSKWTELSNGYTWREASNYEKMELCNSLAAKSAHGVSAQIFFDTLNATYAGADPNSAKSTLNIPLRLSVQYVEESMNPANYR